MPEMAALKLSAATGTIPAHGETCLVEFYFEGEKKSAFRDFSGKAGQRLLYQRRMWVGLGPRAKFNADALRKAAAEAANSIAAHDIRSAAMSISSWPGTDPFSSAELIAESVRLSQYRYRLHSEPAPNQPLASFTFFCRNKSEQKRLSESLARISAIADGVDLAREISNLPGNLGTPSTVVKMAKRMAANSRGAIRLRVLDKNACRKLGMGAFLSVAQGSGEPPAFLIMEYRPRAARSKKPIVLVGKGVTFDSGGLSIKPADSMMEMKNDKSGAGTVIGIMSAAAKLKPNAHLIGVTPLTENLSGDFASRPGDVVKSLSGITIEIKNTDAEGRLILADALTYAGRLNPDMIIDFATLTGACGMALGDVYAALLTNNDTLAHALCEAGESTGERLWRLPMHDGYERMIKSSVADLQNIPEPRLAGTIIGGMFLKKFLTDNKTPWAHIDIAATAWDAKGREGRPAGATGIGVRLFFEFLKMTSM